MTGEFAVPLRELTSAEEEERLLRSVHRKGSGDEKERSCIRRALTQGAMTFAVFFLILPVLGISLFPAPAAPVAVNSVLAAMRYLIKSRTVSVIGSWDNYKNDIVMTDDDGDGIYEATVEIKKVTADMISTVGSSSVIKSLEFYVHLDTTAEVIQWGEINSGSDPKTLGSKTPAWVPVNDSPDVTKLYNVGDHIKFRVFLDTTKNNPFAVSVGAADPKNPNPDYFYVGADNVVNLTKNSNPKYESASAYVYQDVDGGAHFEGFYLTDDDKDGILEGIVDIDNAPTGLSFVLLDEGIVLSDRWADFDPKDGRTYDSGVPIKITDSYSAGDHIRFRVFLDTTQNHPKSVANGFASASKPERKYYYAGYDSFTVVGAAPAPTPTPTPTPTPAPASKSVWSYEFGTASETIPTSNSGIVQKYDITVTINFSDLSLFANPFEDDVDDSDNKFAVALKWFKKKGIDISNQVYLTKSTVTSKGQEQTDDMIFVGDPDDMMNAYIPQGTLTLKYDRKDEYYIITGDETPEPEWTKINGEAIINSQ